MELKLNEGFNKCGGYIIIVYRICNRIEVASSQWNLSRVFLYSKNNAYHVTVPRITERKGGHMWQLMRVM